MRQETKYTLIVTTRSHLQRKRFCNRHSNSCSHRCCVLNTINSDHRVTYSDVLHRCRCKPAIGSGTDDRGRQRRMSRLRKARPSAPSCSTCQWFLPMAKLMVLQCACIFGAMPLPSRATLLLAICRAGRKRRYPTPAPNHTGGVQPCIWS